jgi:diguanylate cyclase (GGDEF)-like protein
MRRPFGEPATLWLYLAYEWAAGTTLLLGVLLSTEARSADRWDLYGVCAVAYACVAGMLAGRDRLPASLVAPALLLGDVLISLVVYFSGEPQSFFALYYVWLNVYVFYFFGRRTAWAHTVAALACYAATLSLLADTVPLAPWLMVAGTMAIVGSMVGSLRGRVDRLVGELADAARRDALTGLLNRRGFAEAISLEIERSRRTGRPFGLVVADIDHFKLVNDRAGHHAGDEVLRRIGALLSTGKRHIDGAARLGGEEFALLVPDADADGALALAERLRRQVRQRFGGDAEPVTMSFGIATFPADAGSAGELLQAADGAMYRAKRRGRDRCELHRPAVQPASDRAA